MKKPKILNIISICWILRIFFIIMNLDLQLEFSNPSSAILLRKLFAIINQNYSVFPQDLINFYLSLSYRMIKKSWTV